MRGSLFSIGEMAQFNHVSIPTLRLYDKMNLLKPAYVDPETGYRYYSIHQNARLDMIAYMKELGMSLAEISQVLATEDLAQIEVILTRKNEQIHQQLLYLKEQHSAVERALASIERYRKSPLTGTLSLEYIDRRYIWGIPCKNNFYTEGLDCYEQELIELRKQLILQNICQVHSYSVGTSILQNDFQMQRFIPDKVFIFTNTENAQGLQTDMLDSGMYACIYLDGFDDETRCAKKLLDFCREHRFTIVGDYICEVLTEFNIFDHQKRSMFLRLQIPVSF